jgi:mRNA interferase RelE/StbE
MYKIEFKKKVEKELRKIDRQYVQTLLGKIKMLEKEPFPSNSRKLTGSAMSYRLRVGDYRVIYQVDDNSKIITIFQVRNRKDAYR